MLNYFVENERSFMDKIPCRTLLFIRRMYILEILNGHLAVCHHIFHMQKHVFRNVFDSLKEKDLLRDGEKVNVEEGVAMFFMIIGHIT